ncbi:MAG: phosphopantetheine-binding protein [Planctomycetia bacterium]|nr:phosphopantetheine-binding protein [Planctomycetia bacterium]
MSTTGKIIFFDATEARRLRKKNSASLPASYGKTIEEKKETIISSPASSVAAPEVIAEKTVSVEKTEPKKNPSVEKSESPVNVPREELDESCSMSSAELDAYLINFVVEQTGYPEDMVNLDADLEGDLGIDSIKKAQLLGELNEMFHFAGADASSAESSLTLDDFPTLRTIRDYMLLKMGSSDQKSAPVEKSESPANVPSEELDESCSMSSAELDAYLINFVVEQTGYPEDMVNLDADLEGDLGIDSIKKAQLLGELNEMFHFAGADASSAESSLTLDDFPTLRTIRDYMLLKMGSSDQKSAPVEKSESPANVPSEELDESCSMSSAELDAYLINFVVEQTGYPEDMVNLDADLEGDLGIDSIKKAQLLGELNEMFHFAGADASSAESSLTLDDFPTLRTIRDYMLLKMGSSDQKSETGSISEKSITIRNYLINFVAEQTGYPEDLIDLNADLATVLGIDSIKKAQLLGELSEMYQVCPLENSYLSDFTTLKQIHNAIMKELS